MGINDTQTIDLNQHQAVPLEFMRNIYYISSRKAATGLLLTAMKVVCLLMSNIYEVFDTVDE